MTKKDEDYLFRLVEKIRDETHENNVMLKAIIKYLTYEAQNATNENVNDFGRNILANMFSNMFELNNIIKRR